MTDQSHKPATPAPGSAVAELASDDASRKKFFKIVGAGGVAAFATLLAACGL
jgi:hypothetical protein